MSILTATQVPKPEEEAPFERGMRLLWKHILKDPAVQLYGRRGQRQHGIDLFGNRDRDPKQFVGIQCKVRTKGKLEAEEVKRDFTAALKKFDDLKEYFVCTTADDDAALQDLANELTREQAKSGRGVIVRIWGWQTLEQQFLEYPDVKLAFDPTYGLFGQKQSEELEKQSAVLEGVEEKTSQIFAKVDSIETRINVVGLVADTSTQSVNLLERVLDEEVNQYRDMLNCGKALAAKTMLESMYSRVKSNASGKILFRIKANIGFTLLHAGEESKAGEILLEAYNFAPLEPKAKANYALGLILLGKEGEALDYAKSELAADPANEFLPVYILQAAARIPDEPDPFESFSPKLKKNADILVAHADFLRSRGLTPDWWLAAHAAYNAKPENGIAAQYFAESELEQLGKKEELWLGGELPADDLRRINNAVKILKDRWSFIKSSETPDRSDGLAAVCNLITALTFLERYDEAIAISEEAFRAAPNDQATLLRVAVAAVEGGSRSLAESAVKNLKADGPGLLLKIQYHAYAGDWNQLAELGKTADTSTIPEHERLIATTILKIASFKSQSAEVTRESLENFEKQVADDARALSLFAEFAKKNEFEDIAERAIARAESLIGKRSHRASRYMVALKSAAFRRWASVILLLDGFVSVKLDTQELRILIDAFTNERPPRRKAVEFFNSLSRDLKSDPKVAAAFGNVHAQRGSVDEAELWFRKSLKSDPNNLVVIINLFKIFYRQQYENRLELMKAELNKLNLSSVHGSPTQKIALAHAMADVGDDRALAFAYECLQQNPNSPEAVVGYLSLIVSNESRNFIPESKIIENGRWVRLRNQHGEELKFIIEGERDSPAEGFFSLSHPLVVAALGKNVGDHFTIEKSIGGADIWEVLEIKHKYLHALHSNLDQFNAKFPSATSLYSIKTKKNDVQPILDEVKRFSEANDEFAQLYLIKKIPLAFVAGMRKRDPISFAEFIRSGDQNIDTCVGVQPERDAATAAIRESKTIVLDLYSAWVCATVEVLEALSKKFKLIVPRSAVDEIVTIQDENDGLRGQQSMTIGWQSGQYIRIEHTVEQQQSQAKIIAGRRAQIESYCEIAPADIPDTRSELERIILANFGGRVLDPVYLAADHKCLLLSEDMYFRQFAQNISKVNGTWLQPVLLYLKQLNVLSDQEYAKAIVGLSFFRHSYLSLDGRILFKILQMDNTPKLFEFKAAAQFIGGKTAEIASHIRVVEAFIVEAWERDKFSIKSQLALGALLENLITGRSDWRLILDRLGSFDLPVFKQYLNDWIFGHFLEVSRHRIAE